MRLIPTEPGTENGHIYHIPQHIVLDKHTSSRHTAGNSGVIPSPTWTIRHDSHYTTDPGHRSRSRSRVYSIHNTHPGHRHRLYTEQGVDHEVVYYNKDRSWTWKPLNRFQRPKHAVQHKQMKMVESKRNETVLRNLANEILNDDECIQFKQALHHFRVSHSVTTLCQQLKPVINTTSKLLLLVELSMRMPANLQDDFHQLCSLQFPNYDTYLKLFTSGNSSSEMPGVIAKDSNGKFKMVSRGGSEKKMFMRYNNQKQGYELRSVPGTSVTSGVYSNGSDEESVFDEADTKDNQGRATPVHLVGKKNVHKVFLNRHDDGSLGLGITGGKEYGTQLVINVVEEGGPAATQGLQIGDKILEVNGHNFHNITHAEAVQIMRHAWNLIILIQRPSERTESDEDEVDATAVVTNTQDPIRDIELVIYPADTGRLGCITQRLASQDLLVKQVEPNSSASKAGVRLHDLIYKIDSISVRELSEKQIVMLTNAKRINLSIRRYVPQNDEFNGVSRSRVNSESAPLRMYRTSSQPRSEGRDYSPESHHSSHHSTRHPTQRYFRSRSAYFPNPKHKPEHLVFGDKQKEANWIIAQKPREHRYTQRREMTMSPNAHSFPVHGRSRSEGRNEYIYRHSHVARASDRDGSRGRYIRNRSQSPHRNTIQRVHHEDNVIRAIQMGLEKRQRAIRRSLYQMPDPVDYEWEI